MSQILVKCQGGFLDGEVIAVNPRNNSYFYEDNQILTVRIGQSPITSHKAFNNKKSTIITSHVSAALDENEEIELYVLIDGDNFDTSLAYYEYQGNYGDYLKNLHNL